MINKAHRFSLSRLTIKQRLPLLICSLLLICIAVYGFANYYSLKKANLTIGRNRLQSLTTQMNSASGQLAALYITSAISLSKQPSVIQFVSSGGKEFQNEAREALGKLKSDTSWVLAELLDKNLKSLSYTGKNELDGQVSLKQVIASANLKPDSARITKLYRVNRTAYYPLIASISNKGQIVGYAIAWKSILTTSKAVAQFSQFVGLGSDFFVGNADGTLWTDFVRPIPNVPFKMGKQPGLINYKSTDGSAMTVDLQPLAHTGLVFGIGISEKSMLKDLGRFVSWIIVIGVLILVTGIVGAWLMSRSITRPLDELIRIAAAISQGNYSQTVPIDHYQHDEIGRLASAFNTMIGQVSQSHHELERRVEERTLQLATVNKELEAFSYSVSHDLRTPLRAINGYSIILKEDYEDGLDSEGKRIVKNIINNAKMMGQLIDDLLAFSRLGKKELTRVPVNMQLLMENTVRDLLQHEPENKYQVNMGLLSPSSADEVMIRQVAVNLVSNAIKYSAKKDHPMIEIGAYDEENRTTYFIRDNGAGFDMAYSNKLFGVFQRLHSQEDFEGSGVGLALVKRIIDKHDGEVWADGIENVGATFYFSLPKF